MSAFSLLILLFRELCEIAGQLFLKHAMSLPDGSSRQKFFRSFASGIGSMALGFFLWLGLLQKFDLSRLYPLEGLNRILLVLGASLFLREKMSPSVWLGVLLISAGVILVVAS